MANHEINEEQEAVNKALRMIETSDPVHADVYNALFSILINNDVFLEKLANKMVQQVMISHVMDSTNPDMVMGADQGPVITKLIEKVQEQVNVLNTKRLSGRFSVDLGTYWDGTEKTFSISFPEDGTYLLYVRVHIVGANKMDAGSSVVLSGNGITATYPESIPLAKDWDRWRSAVFIVPTTSGTYDYSLTGNFQGSRADANYGSSILCSVFKLSSAI